MAAAAPKTPVKGKPTPEQENAMALSEENMTYLRRLGSNVRNELTWKNNNYNAEPVKNLSPTQEYFLRTQHEPSRQNIRAGFATPQRQVRNTSMFALPPKAPGAPVKQAPSRSRRNTRRARKTRRRRN